MSVLQQEYVNVKMWSEKAGAFELLTVTLNIQTQEARIGAILCGI